MFAQIKHMAIVSSNVNHEGGFCKDILDEALWVARTGGTVVVRDGYIGLNLNPRAPGRRAGLITSGLSQDVDWFSRGSGEISQGQVLDVRAADLSPALALTIRRAMSSTSHNMEWKAAPTCPLKKTSKNRRISHFGLRVVQPDEIGSFYRTVFDLIELKNLGMIPSLSLRWKSDARGHALANHQIFRLRHRRPASTISAGRHGAFKGRLESMRAPAATTTGRIKIPSARSGKNYLPSAASASFKCPIPMAC
jgi:hypothetical protein